MGPGGAANGATPSQRQEAQAKTDAAVARTVGGVVSWTTDQAERVAWGLVGLVLVVVGVFAVTRSAR